MTIYKAEEFDKITSYNKLHSFKQNTHSLHVICHGIFYQNLCCESAGTNDTVAVTGHPDFKTFLGAYKSEDIHNLYDTGWLANTIQQSAQFLNLHSILMETQVCG